MYHSCAYCEKEFNVPNVGFSHGICKRHFEKIIKDLNKDPLEIIGNKKIKYSIDLSTLSPEELKLAINLHSIIKKRKKQ